MALYQIDDKIKAYKGVDSGFFAPGDGYVHDGKYFHYAEYRIGKETEFKTTPNAYGNGIEFSCNIRDVFTIWPFDPKRTVILECIVPSGSMVSTPFKRSRNPEDAIEEIKGARTAKANAIAPQRIVPWEEVCFLMKDEPCLALCDKRIKRLPSIKYNMPGLKELYLDDTGIEDLPEGIAWMTGLETLSMARTPLETIPEAVYGLKLLKNLCLSGSRLFSVSRKITRLANLKELDVSETMIDGLPREIAAMDSLKVLNLSWCSELHELPRLPHLDELIIDGLDLVSIPTEMLSVENTGHISMYRTTIRHLPEEQMAMLAARKDSIDIFESQFHCASNPSLGFDKNSK